MISQRQAIPDELKAPRPGVLWDPRVPGLEPRPDDIYLVVDEQDERTLVVVAAGWPEVDGLGRVRFPGKTLVPVGVSEQALQTATSRAVPTATEPRQIRIGDVFLVRGLPNQSNAQLRQMLRNSPPVEWGEFFDVTGAAREAAKAAFFAAAAPRVSADHAEALGLTKQAPAVERPRSATTASPSV